ncbi:substrate-binding periplasmic protein [Legionella yabuuchiae]|uniref:substrate-binding periplasmic protein n=1 Tax=Legionella yabuuchiae TaxID=376727 RepID=UPI001055DC51|nr:transporter substrate-binding domain-containing protein [Legionella yabuuchiae]
MRRDTINGEMLVMSKIRQFIVFGLLMMISQLTFALKFTIGVTPFFPPYTIKTSQNTYTGFEIDLMNRICRDLKAECSYVSKQFDELIPSVQDGSIDIAIGMIIPTPDRRKLVQFSLPYLASTNRILARKELDTSNIKHKGIPVDFLLGKRIAVIKDSIHDIFLQKIKLKNTVIIRVNTDADLVLSLVNDNADIAVADNGFSVWWADNASDHIKSVDEPFQILDNEVVSIAIGDKSGQYLSAINNSITAWQRDGSFKKTYDLYFEEF